jgi:hypothetical protein
VLRVPIRTKKKWLRVWYRQAVAATVSLQVQLESVLDTSGTNSASGLTLIKTAANGHVSEFADPSKNGIGGTDGIGDLANELLDLLSMVEEQLIGEGIPTPTDLQLHDRMQSLLVSRPSSYGSNLYLRTDVGAMTASVG